MFEPVARVTRKLDIQPQHAAVAVQKIGPREMRFAHARKQPAVEVQEHWNSELKLIHRRSYTFRRLADVDRDGLDA